LSEDPILAPLVPFDTGLARNIQGLRWVLPVFLLNQELLSSQLFNQYPYTQNNPVIMRDPYGLFPWCEATCAAGCAIGCTTGKGCGGGGGGAGVPGGAGAGGGSSGGLPGFQ
jgi:hypothetical protein